MDKVRENLFKTLRILSITGSGVLSFLIALIALRFSRVDLTPAILLSLLFSATIVLARLYFDRHGM